MDMLHHHTSDDGNDDKKLRRREQNRLSAQRSYHKKQERLTALRSQVAQLEATYERQVTSLPHTPGSPNALLSIPSNASSPASISEDFEAKSDVVSPSSPPLPSGHLQQLLTSRTQLQSENEALRRRLEAHSRFQFRLQSLGAGEDVAVGDVGLTVVHNSITGSPRFQPRVQMKRPLTVEECYAMGSNGYQYMSKYRFPNDFMTTGSTMCGWSDKRVMENGLLKVELRKTFRGHDVETVARTAWLAVQDPRKMDALYSLNMNMHSEIAQYIDDNNVVMYQSFETPERDAKGKETGAVCVMHHVMLLTMFASETGYVIIFCSLDPDRLDDSDHVVDLAEEEEATARGVVKRRHKQWFKKFSWLTFDRVGDPSDDAFELAYHFTVPPHHGANYYWPLEVILLMMRFEVEAVGPVILLPSSSDECLEEEHASLEIKEELSSLEELSNLDVDDDDESAVVMIENKAVKIEPLTHDQRPDILDVGGPGDVDMSELFIELFPQPIFRPPTN